MMRGPQIQVRTVDRARAITRKEVADHRGGIAIWRALRSKLQRPRQALPNSGPSRELENTLCEVERYIVEPEWTAPRNGPSTIDSSQRTFDNRPHCAGKYRESGRRPHQVSRS
jgi:hypothetical protein